MAALFLRDGLGAPWTRVPKFCSVPGMLYELVRERRARLMH
jgi:hypothetical protein